MNLKTIQDYYPKYETLIGFYNHDQTFYAHSYNDIKDIDRWDEAPLDWLEGYLPFIVYCSEGRFECYGFAYWRVEGYYTSDGDDFDLVTHSDEFGWEVYDPFNMENDMQILESDYEEAEEYGWANCRDYEWRVEQAAKRFDTEAYTEGRIFTSYDAVKIFCAQMEKTNRKD